MANLMIEAPYFSMDPRQVIVRTWPKSWGDLQRDCISRPGFVRWTQEKLYVISSQSPYRVCPDAYPYATEYIIKAFRRCFRHLNHRPRRVPQECEEVLEKSSEEAFASWMP